MEKKRSLAQKINVMRAAVMGANDGILSVAGIVIGVAGATDNNYAIFLAGIAGMLAGTVSMAMGEYVSVNAQKDAQKKAIIQQESALSLNYSGEVAYVKNKYMSKGIQPELAARAASEMMKKNALLTSVRERFGFDINEFTSPYAAALSSMISFPLGSILPLLAITLLPESIKVFATFISVVIALAITGFIAAVLGNSNRRNSVMRNTVSGILTMLVTYGIGILIGR
ncbi:VIT family protein [Liquorilactobacillus mali]|uniref:VIT1/CCC1 transporter family protein n=1 Tax=Liquorilactobacillus mali TaxID=1618 RepID=UPI002654EB22|nr:VIT family protein [Liquorilactobacillus mali]MDN7146415.1 VIT family protein [Liquorilactobacillus mali]